MLHLAAHALVWVDLAYRIYLAELNRSKNAQRQAAILKSDETGSSQAPEAVACLVGYREEPQLFEAALTSYLVAGCKYLVVGIDGNTDADQGMVHVFNKVVAPHRKTVVLQVEACVGQEFMENAFVEDFVPSAATRAPNAARDALEFDQAYNYLRTALEKSTFLDAIRNGDGDGDGHDDWAICFTQPHRDLKEIRLAAWVLSIVVADAQKVDFLWSSDSDTMVRADTISSLTRIVAAEPKAAGGSALVQLNNAPTSFISRMAHTSFNCDAILNRSANAALGVSECLNGPGSLFRIAALRTAAAAWYRCQYPGSPARSVLNEDMQVTMILGKDGWSRLYSERSIIDTAGPTHLKGWVGQRIRWSRGIHLHRVHDYRYVLSQGLLYTAYMIRSALYDPLLLIWTSYFALTGTQLVRLYLLDVLALEGIPPIYNYFRPARARAGLVATLAPYLSFRAIAPAYRMYTFLTPGKESWALPAAARAFSFDPEMGFVYLWFTVMAVAASRALWALF